MSKYQQVGRSIHTESKQMHFEYFLKTHFCITNAAIKKNAKWICPEYFYADIFAGDGGIGTQDGSPVIFESVNNEYKIDCNPIFIEHNPATAIRLRDRISYPVIEGENESVLPSVPVKKNQLGLLYVDPNGDPPFDLLRSFYSKDFTDKIDLLIYFSGTTIKRALKSPTAQRDVSLKDEIASIPKKHWLIRSSVGKFQWSFLMGTNWTDFPKMKKINFHPIDSRFGGAILNKLNHTASELKQINFQEPLQYIQQNLFN